MNRKISTLITLLSLTGLFGCDKAGSSFSVLSGSASFQQAATFVPRKLDVLFVVDNSASMKSSQTNLAANFPAFITYFKNKGYDFRLAVTTTDAYYGDQFVASACSLCNTAQTKFRSSTNPAIYVIDNNTPNLESAFSQNAQVGITGSGDERAFSSFKAALSSSLNVGFHRADAYLSVIIVSDGDDFSHDDINLNESYAQATLHPLSTYTNYLNTYTNGNPITDYSVTTIGVLDAACRDLLKTENKISVRYMALSDLTGGSKNSVCNSFATVLDNISSSIASHTQAQFNLTSRPDPASIRVIIDGILIPQSTVDGWSYDSVANIIHINGTTYQPQAGASITINFDPEKLN